MKDQKESKEKVVRIMYGMELTTNEELSKYSGLEYEPEKLKEIRKKFAKGIVIN